MGRSQRGAIFGERSASVPKNLLPMGADFWVAMGKAGVEIPSAPDAGSQVLCSRLALSLLQVVSSSLPTCRDVGFGVPPDVIAHFFAAVGLAMWVVVQQN